VPNSKRISLKTYSEGGTQIERVETAVGAIPERLADHGGLFALLDATQRYIEAHPQLRRIEIQIVNSGGQ